MKRIFTFFSLVLFPYFSFAQKENNVWIFGNKLGIDFNLATPSIVSSSIQSVETCTSVCDTSGKLLFYSNGLTVWDNTHSPMPNGSGLLGCDGGIILPGSFRASASLGAAIVPILGHPDLYYLFTLQEQELFSATPPSYKGELRYSIIDMKLNSGKGDIIPSKKNILLDSGMSERMTVLKADCGVWLVTIHNDKNTFYAYKIDSKDSIHKRVVSDFSTTTYSRQYMVGHLKSSPDGTKIVCATNGKNTVELFDFDKSTGILSSLKLIESGKASTYSVEFSEDNSKLYTVGFNGYIAQYDLSLLPSVSAVTASQYVVDGVNRHTSLRLAPNGKIYSHGFAMNQISVINNPNLAGAACNFVINVSSLKNTNTLPYSNFGNKTVSIENLKSASKIDTTICDTNKYVVVGSPANSGYLWNDGDTSRIKTLTSSGTYWRKSNNKCLLIADTFIVKFISKSVINSKTDTAICNGLNVSFSLDNSFTKILWNDLDTSRIKTISNSGIYYRKAEKDCKIYIDTFNVVVKNVDTTKYNHDTTACFNTQISITSPIAANNYLWNDGNPNRTTIINNGEKKWVYALNTANCAVRIDTFKLTSIIFSSNIGDTFLCKDEEIIFDATIPNATKYNWHNGVSISTFKTKTEGKYWVQISVGNCTLTDSVLVVSKKLNLNLGEDNSICKNETLLLETKISNAKYLWSNGEQTASILISEKGNYAVTVSKDGCTETDDINIDLIECTNCLVIPNAFTPNNDSRNDLFRPIFRCPVDRYEILIVNRYGQEIFKTNNIYEAWNGLVNNQEQELGVFYYLIKVKFNYPNSKEEIIKGDVTLIR